MGYEMARGVRMLQISLGGKKHTEGCMICGDELIYSENAQTYRCSLCKKEFTSTISCAHGHFICDECHRADANEIIKVILESSLSTNPLSLPGKLWLPLFFKCMAQSII
jgi:Zn finger protein HypA/HybF involved in hydrogenase expression